MSVNSTDFSKTRKEYPRWWLKTKRLTMIHRMLRTSYSQLDIHYIYWMHRLLMYFQHDLRPVTACLSRTDKKKGRACLKSDINRVEFKHFYFVLK
jgi:hypothetical protein